MPEAKNTDRSLLRAKARQYENDPEIRKEIDEDLRRIDAGLPLTGTRLTPEDLRARAEAARKRATRNNS